MEKKIVSVLKYFSLFAYQPTSEEIYTFLQAKISRNSLNIELDRMVRQKIIVNCKLKIENSNIYTPPQYSIPTLPRLGGASKYKISKKKLENWRFKIYVKLVSFFPQIRLIGLSGSISMMNAEENDDIDLFIITAKKRLFTGRLIALVFAQLLGLRRQRQLEKLDTVFFDRLTPKGPQAIVSKKVYSLFNNETMKQLNNHTRNKVCLNLFFDESNLSVPKFKQTVFVGHEVLQMKPIIIKDNIYEKFLVANLWVQNIFPNSSWFISKINPPAGGQRSKTNSKLKSLNFKLGFDICTLIFDLFEKVFKKLQLISINRHRTTEIITPTQLWFHPDDFEMKIKY